VITTNAGTSALLLAMEALGIGPEDEVIVPATSYGAVLSAVAHVGATPVPVDCDALTGNPTPELIEARIGPRTRLVVIGHHTGFPADMVAIMALARHHGFFVLENCAHALGSSIGERPVGSFGHVATVSMSHKHLSVAGTGGALLTDDDGLAERVAELRHQGFRTGSRHVAFDRYEVHRFGHKMFLNELQAIVGDHQMDVMPEWNTRRRRHALRYRDALEGLPLTVPREPDGTRSAFLHVPILTPQREALRAHLADRGIAARIHYAIPVHLLAAARATYGFEPGLCPVAERYCDQVLSLPGAPHLSDDDVEDVIGAIRAFCAD